MTLDERRRAYAEGIASTARVTTPGLEKAFAAVARESFLPPGPWTVVGEREAPRQTPGADPQFVYENVSVAIPNLTQLRRDPHESTPDCWLHAARFCLSMQPV